MNGIVSPDYTFGSYVRKSFRDNIFYYFYTYFDIDLIKRGELLLWKDLWMDRLLAEQVIDSPSRNGYRGSVEALAKGDNPVWDASVEELYLEFHKLRLEYIPEKAFSEYRAKACAGLSPRLPAFIGIDQTRWKNRLLREKNNILMAVGDFSLLRAALEEAASLRASGREIFLLLKEASVTPCASVADLERLLEQGRLDAKLIADGKIRILRDPWAGRGIDFSAVPRHEELSAAVEEGDVFLLGYGEDVFLSVKDLTIPSVVYTGTRTIYARAATNLFSGSGQSLVYVPDHFNIFRHIPMVELSRVTYLQLSRLAERFGDEIYRCSVKELRERYPCFFLNIYSDRPEADAKLLEGFAPGKELWDDLPAMIAGKVSHIDSLSAGGGTKLFAAYHDYGEEGITLPAIPGSPNKTLINGLIMEHSENARVLIVESYEGLSFRQYMRSRGILDAPSYLCNFMFFSTPRILEAYNRFRQDRPEEQIAPECAHMDYFHVGEGGAAQESFPLYNKACIAKYKDGRFLFFNFRLGGGEISWLGCRFRWNAEDVDPTEPGDVAVYTPYLSVGDEGKDPMSYTKAVGEGRINLVVIGDRIRCVREGDVLLPPIGVVVSLSKPLGESLFERGRLTAAGDGYYLFDTPGMSLTLDPPGEVGQERWGGIDWAYGGGMALIKNGASIYGGGQSPESAFREEGWLSPLSVQTQESALHDEREEHPRTVLGLTADNKLFVLVFSGRSSLSRSVGYREVIRLARKYVGDISYMMNVDGGASSFMGFAAEGTFMELNYPGCTDMTCTGSVRSVNSVLIL